MTAQHGELGALLSWAVRNGFCAHVSTTGGHIITTLNRTPYAPPRINGINPLYVTEAEEATMGIYGPSNNLRVVHRGR